jgi:hypothetical protein
VASSETSLHPSPDLQNNKDPPGVAGGASSDDQVSPVFKEEGEEERERLVDPASNDFSLLPFISLHAICPFCPCHAHCPMGTSDIFSDLI